MPFWPFHPGVAQWLHTAYAGPFRFVRHDGVLVTVV